MPTAGPADAATPAPPTGSVVCDFCAVPIDPKIHACYRRVLAWVPYRQNSLGTTTSLAEPAIGWACTGCVDYRKGRGGPSPDQPNLF